MAPKVKEAVGVLSDALETACGWAIAALAVYALLFVDLTGNGRLWDAVRGVARDTTANATREPSTASVVTRVVPVRPPDMETKAQNHMLMVPEVPEQEIKVPVVAQIQRPDDALTDAPADSHAGKDWRVHLKGELRSFTVYGQGEQSSSASASAAAGSSAKSAPAASAPTASVASSAYRVGSAAEARPGIGERASRVTDGASDGVRNFR